MTYPETAVLRPRQCAKYLSISLATFWRLTKSDPAFPKPFKIGTQSTGVLRADVDTWLQQRKGGQ